MASAATTRGIARRRSLPRNVYRLDPKTGKMDVVVGDLSMPNGLCFSPDQKKFYVTGHR
jgi:gluconolactonase